MVLMTYLVSGEKYNCDPLFPGEDIMEKSSLGSFTPMEAYKMCLLER